MADAPSADNLKEEGKRLTALVNVLGFASIDNLEAFLAQHGAARVVPASSIAATGASLPLEDTQTQGGGTLCSDTRHAKRNEERERENMRLRSEVEEVRKELDSRRRKHEKNVDVVEDLRRDKTKLLTLIDEADAKTEAALAGRGGGISESYEEEVAALAEESSALYDRIDQLEGTIAEVEKQQKTMEQKQLERCEKLISKFDRLQSELDEVKFERDEVFVDRDEAIAERDEARAEAEDAQAENDRLRVVESDFEALKQQIGEWLAKPRPAPVLRSSPRINASSVSRPLRNLPRTGLSTPATNATPIALSRLRTSSSTLQPLSTPVVTSSAAQLLPLSAPLAIPAALQQALSRSPHTVKTGNPPPRQAAAKPSPLPPSKDLFPPQSPSQALPTTSAASLSEFPTVVLALANPCSSRLPSGTPSSTVAPLTRSNLATLTKASLPSSSTSGPSAVNAQVQDRRGVEGDTQLSASPQKPSKPILINGVPSTSKKRNWNLLSPKKKLRSSARQNAPTKEVSRSPTKSSPAKRQGPVILVDDTQPQETRPQVDAPMSEIEPEPDTLKSTEEGEPDTIRSSFEVAVALPMPIPPRPRSTSRSPRKKSALSASSPSRLYPTKKSPLRRTSATSHEISTRKSMPFPSYPSTSRLPFQSSPNRLSQHSRSPSDSPQKTELPISPSAPHTQISRNNNNDSVLATRKRDVELDGLNDGRGLLFPDYQWSTSQRGEARGSKRRERSENGNGNGFQALDEEQDGEDPFIDFPFDGSTSPSLEKKQKKEHENRVGGTNWNEVTRRHGSTQDNQDRIASPESEPHDGVNGGRSDRGTSDTERGGAYETEFLSSEPENADGGMAWRKRHPHGQLLDGRWVNVRQ